MPLTIFRACSVVTSRRPNLARFMSLLLLDVPLRGMMDCVSYLGNSEGIPTFLYMVNTQGEQGASKKLILVPQPIRDVLEVRKP